MKTLPVPSATASRLITLADGRVSPEGLRQWFLLPCPALDGERPLDHASDTLRLVEALAGDLKLPEF